MHSGFVEAIKQNLPALTFTIALDIEHIKTQAKSIYMANMSQKEITNPLDAKHILHMTPFVVNSADTAQALLSDILKSLSEIHIIVRIVASEANEEVNIHDVILDEFKQYADYIADITATDTPNTHWIDMMIPDDSNIILGACRNQDHSF